MCTLFSENFVTDSQSQCCSITSLFKIQCQHPMSTSSLWFAFSQARIITDLSILFLLPAVYKPQTENNHSMKAGADTKSWAIGGRTEYTLDCSFWSQKSMALPSNNIDSDLLMWTYIKRTVSRCFASLCQLRQIRHSVPTATLQMLMLALVHS